MSSFELRYYVLFIGMVEIGGQHAVHIGVVVLSPTELDFRAFNAVSEFRSLLVELVCYVEDNFVSEMGHAIIDRVVKFKPLHPSTCKFAPFINSALFPNSSSFVGIRPIGGRSALT